MLEFIDISMYNAFTDWKKVASLKKGCLIKIGQNYWKDSAFDSHWRNAGSVGMARGIWHFYQPDTPPGAQIDGFLKLYSVIEGWKPKAVFLDCEEIWYKDRDGNYVVIRPPGTAAYTYFISEWIGNVQRALGFLPGIYTRKSFWDAYIYPSGTIYYYGGIRHTAPDWSQCPLWVANYGVPQPALPHDWAAWDFWQYSGDSATIEGMASEVDLDYCAWSEEKINALMREPQEPPPPMNYTTFLLTVSR